MTSSSCFVYGRLLDLSLLEGAAPGAVFDRIAHLPAHRLSFSESGDAALVDDEGHTVWGAVFVVPDDKLEAIGTAADGSPIGRRTAHAVDREGERIEVVVFSGADGGRPDEETVGHMVSGGRQWELPAGWIVGLLDLVDPFEF
ncbi:hypothetical protein BH23ACT5_BH23ACT5_15870 [soil metagenome]